MPNNDSHQHVVKTTSQWNDRAVEYWVVPRGCLCIELTPEGKTKLKVGEGNKFYHQLPYVCEGSDLSNYYTKEEIDNIIDNINRMAIMSTDEYDSKNDLPLDGNKLGDVRFVKSNTPSTSTEPDIYLWNGTKWIFVGTDISSIDLDDFVKKEEFEVVKDKVDIMYPKMHEHTNKNVLDQTTAPFTIPEKEKLAGLHNYDDTEIRELIHETGHTHPNKSLLDTITSSSLWNEADRIKFNDLHNYDDTEVIVRIETLEEKSHTHSNKNILDQTTAPFQVADKEKLDSLQNYDVFRGTDGIYPGGKGLVPGPTIADSGKFLSSSGEWLHVTVVANDFVGATENTDGVHGLVPAPLAGQESYYLRGDGTWAEVQDGKTYAEGEAIKFEYESVVSSDPVTHVKWSLLQTRGRKAGTSDNCIQVREFEMRNINDELISFKSNVTGVFDPSSTTPVYGSSQTPDALVDGTSRKMCCTNFTSSITEFIFTMELATPVSMNRIKDYRYITGEDEPNRDPISWVLYVSSDGTNFIEVDRRINQTITQSRSTGTSYYTPTFPSTLSTTINVQYGDGLEVDNDNDLNVKLGSGLQFDANGAIEAPGGKTYVAGDGIVITDNASFELSEDTVRNTEYFFDTRVTSNVLGRTFTKYNAEPALGAVVYFSSGYTQPYFVGLTADSVKYGTDYDSQISPNPDHPTFEYKGVTWYYSGGQYAMRGDGTDTSGHIQKIPGSYPASTEADFQNIARAIIDAADIITDPTKRISAKLGSGLSFDSNDAIQNEGLLSVTQDSDDGNHLTFGTVHGDIDITIPGGEPLQYVRVSTNDSFVLLHTKPADWDDTWYRYYMLSYDELTVEPPDWDPTRHYKYENDNYVLGSPGDTFVSTTWYDKHYNGLDPNTPIMFDSDVYYTSTLNLIQDGELIDTAFEKVNEAIEHIERLEQNVQFLHDNKVDVRKTVDPERIEFYYS